MRCQVCRKDILVRDVPGIGTICFHCFRELSERLSDKYEELRTRVINLLEDDLTKMIESGRPLTDTYLYPMLSEHNFKLLLGDLISRNDLTDEVRNSIAAYLFSGDVE